MPTAYPHPKPHHRHALTALLLAAWLLTAAGCTAPLQDDPAAAGESAAVAAAPADPAPGPEPAPDRVRDTRPAPGQAPPMSDPLPPLRAPQRDAQRAPRTPAEVPAGTPVKIDTGCSRDADCTVKNVGNCCGYYPACVNVDSPTDPAAVQAQCAREGMMSVCGFQEISACQCVAGQCEPETAAVDR